MEHVRCMIETSLPFITKLIYILLFAKPRLRENKNLPPAYRILESLRKQRRQQERERR